MFSQNNQLGAPEGVPTQSFATRGFKRTGFANRDFTNRGFTTEDILWALGIWSAIIVLSPVIVFYMLMVA